MKGIDQRLRVRQTSSGGPAVWQSPGFVFDTLKLLQSWFETPNACVKPTGAGAANACKVPEKHVTDATICNQTERIVELLAREKGVYRPRIRHAAAKGRNRRSKTKSQVARVSLPARNGQRERREKEPAKSPTQSLWELYQNCA